MPDSRSSVFSLWRNTPKIHLILFVHRVEGVKPGLYCLARTRKGEADLRQELQQEFLWEPTEEGFPLYLLSSGDMRDTASQLSCGQTIAANGAFSLGMLADFGGIEEQAWEYPSLYWEAGLLGQILYLEATAARISGTGIGCFFDDPIHEFLGLRSKRFQSIYHFTVGKAVHDPRVESLPPYWHLDQKK